MEATFLIFSKAMSSFVTFFICASALFLISVADFTFGIGKVTEYQKETLLNALNANRALVANGKLTFELNVKGENKTVKFGTAADMVETKWVEDVASRARNALSTYCDSKTVNLKDRGLRSSAYAYLDSDYKTPVSEDLAAQRYFVFSNQAIPMNLTRDYLTWAGYTNSFSWDRIQVLGLKAELNQIGCAITKCHNATVVLCMHGQDVLGRCNKSCPLYQVGARCSKCPYRTKCAENGLCRQEEEN